MKVETYLGLRCIRCGIAFPPQPTPYTCPSCDGNLNVEYDYDSIRRSWARSDVERCKEPSIWRYLPLLPVAGPVPGPPVGWTPLVASPRLAEQLGVAQFYVKDEGRCASGSLKDRASSVVLARAVLENVQNVVAASSGNAAASTALLAAQLGFRCRFYVPRTIPRAKLAQLTIFGAETLLVDGGYDAAYQLSVSATKRHGWYNRNTGYNPFTREGKKTVAFEICEQLRWEVPDLVVVPVGDGNIISGVWKGFRDFQVLGFINKLPRLLAVQPENAAAVVQALDGSPIHSTVGTTVADSLAVQHPRDGEAAVRSIQESGGMGVTVSDAEIMAAIPILAQGTGIFGEPAAACAFAGLLKAAQQGHLDCNWKVVLLCTGNGLKDIDTALRAVSGR